MTNCPWFTRIETWFDGEITDPAIERHLAACHACAAHLATLRALRRAAATAAVPQHIPDPQLPAFLDGIRDRLHHATPGHPNRLRAALSLAAAALIVTASILAVILSIADAPRPVNATVVESCSTELQGATTTVYASDNGTVTVWVKVPEGDIW